MYCPQGHGSWPGDECGFCGASGPVSGWEANGSPVYDEEAHSPHLASMSPMTRSLLVDMNALFDDWANGPAS